jgi:hypothetical protein
MSAPGNGGGRPSVYRTADGKRVPGVTTILSRFKESGGLIHWAWTMGCEGNDYRKVRDDAATVGHLVHGWIDDDIRGRPKRALPEGMEPSDAAKAHHGYAGFIEWRSHVALEILATEFPLVSELYRYGGTPDAAAIVRVNGKMALMDWKTSNRHYPDHLAQVAAYRQLIHERAADVPGLSPEDGERAVSMGAVVLRVGKDYGDFHHHYYPDAAVSVGWTYFATARRLYDMDAELKRIVS